MLDAPGSELALPPTPGLLVQGCYWPSTNTLGETLSISDTETETADPQCQHSASPEVADAAMEEEDASELVSVHSSPSAPSTLPSSVNPEEVDPQMEDETSDATSSEEEGDCLSNCPASSNMRSPHPGSISFTPGRFGSSLCREKVSGVVFTCRTLLPSQLSRFERLSGGDGNI